MFRGAVFSGHGVDCWPCDAYGWWLWPDDLPNYL